MCRIAAAIGRTVRAFYRAFVLIPTCYTWECSANKKLEEKIYKQNKVLTATNLSLITDVTQAN